MTGAGNLNRCVAAWFVPTKRIPMVRPANGDPMGSIQPLEY
jgi:hypothetical protein